MGKAKALIFDLSSSVSYGRMSKKAKIFWPLLVIKSDDQGRGLAEPDAIKWRVCPNIEEIELAEVPQILDELASPQVETILLYRDSRERSLYQILRWWQPEIGSGSCLLWAQPSEYEAPPGWADRIRAQRGPKRSPFTLNWDRPGGFAQAENNETTTFPPTPELGNQLPNQLGVDYEFNNITKYNLTQPNIIIEAAGNGSTVQEVSEDFKEGANAPPQPPKPQPSNSKTVKETIGQREYRELFSAKRYRTNAQKDAVLELEKKHGTAKLLEAGRWAAEKGMSLGDSIGSVRSALPAWGARKQKGAVSENRNAADAAFAQRFAAELRRSGLGDGLETTGAGGGEGG